MPIGFTAGDPAAARGYDAWFEQRWGGYAWLVESTAVLGACGPSRSRVGSRRRWGRCRSSPSTVERRRE